VPFSYRTIDGGLCIPVACPADIGPTLVWPVEVPGGRLILVAERDGRVCRFDARTGEAIGDPARSWHLSSLGCAAATVPDGRTIMVGATDCGIRRFDLLSGDAYPPTTAEKTSTIRDVTMATLPGGPGRGGWRRARRACLPVGRRDRRADRRAAGYGREGRGQLAR
jgi:hypothetical protein